MDVPYEPDLALIEPEAMTLRTHVDLHVLKVALLQIAATPRTLHEVLAPRDLAALFVEQCAHFLDQLGILARKILVFVSSWMFFCVAMHDPPTRSIRPQSTCGGLLATESGRVESGLADERIDGFTRIRSVPVIVSRCVVSALVFFGVVCVRDGFAAGFGVESAFAAESGFTLPACTTSPEGTSREPGRVRAATSAEMARGELLFPV